MVGYGRHLDVIDLVITIPTHTLLAKIIFYP